MSCRSQGGTERAGLYIMVFLILMSVGDIQDEDDMERDSRRLERVEEKLDDLLRDKYGADAVWYDSTAVQGASIPEEEFNNEDY